MVNSVFHASFAGCWSQPSRWSRRSQAWALVVGALSTFPGLLVGCGGKAFESCEATRSCASGGNGGAGPSLGGSAGSEEAPSNGGDGGVEGVGPGGSAESSVGGAGGEVDAGGEARAPFCGDGRVSDGEACDDGNAANGDGCSSLCKWEPIAMDLGYQHACALFADQSLKCWGNNSSGQLGLGDVEHRGDSLGELGSRLPVVLRDVTAFSTGGAFTCAVSAQKVYCWGDNTNHQLGDLTTTSWLGPVEVQAHFSTPPVELVSGLNHTCARSTDGSVRCWGNNAVGQLGNYVSNAPVPGRAGEALTPVPLEGKAVQLAAGGSTSCARLTDGVVKCWGDGGKGQLGVGLRPAIGLASSGLRPAAVGLGKDFSVGQVSVGETHVCASSTRGLVKCWGDNQSGQLGLGDREGRGLKANDMNDALAPVPFGAARVVGIEAGVFTSCALLESGGVRCWGANYSNQLGQVGWASDNRALGDRALGDAPGEVEEAPPVDLGANGEAQAVGIGADFACALLRRGVVKCWGSNEFGQLGTGSTESPQLFGDALKEARLD